MGKNEIKSYWQVALEYSLKVPKDVVTVTPLQTVEGTTLPVSASVSQLVLVLSSIALKYASHSAAVGSDERSDMPAYVGVVG